MSFELHPQLATALFAVVKIWSAIYTKKQELFVEWSVESRRKIPILSTSVYYLNIDLSIQGHIHWLSIQTKIWKLGVAYGHSSPNKFLFALVHTFVPYSRRYFRLRLLDHCTLQRQSKVTDRGCILHYCPTRNWLLFNVAQQSDVHPHTDSFSTTFL